MIMKAFMPTEKLRQVTTGIVTTGQAKPTGLAVVGTASTGMYGMTEFRFLDVTDMQNLKTDYGTAMGGTAPLALQSPISLDFSRFRIATSCLSRCANTTGTTVVVDFLRFRVKRNLEPATVFPTSVPLATTSYAGSPLVMAQALLLSQQAFDGVKPPDIRDLDFEFWKTPLFSRFYKLLGHSACTLSHGQSVEFKWSLPSVSFSNLELIEQKLATGEYINNKTCFTVWRVRGALGATAQTAATAASTSIAAVAIATTRTYTIRGTPVQGDVRRAYYSSEWPRSATQVWVNNEYGTGAMAQAANPS